MGIVGLLENIRSITTHCKLSHFANCRIAIDASCWLHKGAYNCSKELSLNIPTKKYINYFMNMIELLQSYGIHDIIVIFDGKSLPSKYLTNKNRLDKRLDNLKKGIAADAVGDGEKANKHYQQSISITYDMIKQVIIQLKKRNINYIVSPYESDAQLAYLSMNNLIDIVVTEDSDALAYGCQRVMYKVQRDGCCDYIELANLRHNKELLFTDWTDEQFKLFCCLSGCDYFPRIKNIGIKTVHKIITKHNTLAKVLIFLRQLLGSSNNTEKVCENFIKALMVFRHQTIYNPTTKQVQPLTPIGNYPISSDLSNISRIYDFLGEIIDQETTLLLVSGAINPNPVAEQGITSIPDTDQNSVLNRNANHNNNVDMNARVSAFPTSSSNNIKGIQWIGADDFEATNNCSNNEIVENEDPQQGEYLEVRGNTHSRLPLLPQFQSSLISNNLVCFHRRKRQRFEYNTQCCSSTDKDNHKSENYGVNSEDICNGDYTTNTGNNEASPSEHFFDISPNKDESFFDFDNNFDCENETGSVGKEQYYCGRSITNSTDNDVGIWDEVEDNYNNDIIINSPPMNPYRHYYQVPTAYNTILSVSQADTGIFPPSPSLSL